jgi:hypothetical protein
MNTFEDKLLTELRTVVAERATTPIAVLRKHPRRMLIGVAACLTLAAGTAVAVPILGSSSPAYAVSTQPDGTVEVKIYRLKDGEKLEKDLKAAGVPAEVNFLPQGKTCRRTPAGERPSTDGAPSLEIIRDKTTDGGFVLVLHPAAYRGNTLVLQADPSSTTWAPKRKGADIFPQVARLKTGTFGPCVPVDAVHKTGR